MDTGNIERECKVHGIHTDWRHRPGKQWMCRICLRESKRKERIKRNYKAIKAAGFPDEAEKYLQDVDTMRVDARTYKNVFVDIRRKYNIPKYLARRIFDLNMITKKEIYNVGWECSVCNLHNDSPKFFDIDHIIPTSQGGVDEDENKQVLCPNCHRMKHL